MILLRRNLRVPVDSPPDAVPVRLARELSIQREVIGPWEIIRKGVDARKKPRIFFVLSVTFHLPEQVGRVLLERGVPDLEPWEPEAPEVIRPLTHDLPVLVVGTGPAGLFAADRLVSHGLPVVLLERGGRVAERHDACVRFWREGVLDPESNVQFGEGGAGTFSDGKLTTRLKDSRIRLVLQTLVRYGAPDEILVNARPHVGTDRLRQVVSAMVDDLAARGVDVRFRSRLAGIAFRDGKVVGGIVNGREEIRCDSLILATGNAARDTFAMLHEAGVAMEAKPLAVGFRVEHPQETIDRIQYGGRRHPLLPPADYSLAFTDPASGRGVYSFCMCPGGVVVAASSEEGGVVTNGMSFHSRRGTYANSALVVTVSPDDFPDRSPLAGIHFQLDLERRAYRAGGGGYRAPAEPLLAFLGRRGGGTLRSTYRPGVTEYPLGELLPPVLTDHLRRGITAFDRRMRGFVTSEAVLVGLETRTSSPVRILRGEDGASPTHRGLYPCGEGAGYAGGIMSAALDGIRTADAVIAALRKGRER